MFIYILQMRSKGDMGDMFIVHVDLSPSYIQFQTE